MRRSLVAIWALGLKELASLRRDIVLVLLIVWAFSGSVYAASLSSSRFRQVSRPTC